MLGPSQLVDLRQRYLVGLSSFQISVIGIEPQLGAELPAERRLDSRAAARLRAVRGAEQRRAEVEYVDDLIVELLPVTRQRRLDRSSAITQ